MTFPERESAKDRKRKWFDSKYSNAGKGTVSNAPCKFFSSSGICRKGDLCQFVHDRLTRTPINQPCKYLYQSPFKCSKGDLCHFSHNLKSFSCPFMHIARGMGCTDSCGFDHSPMTTEAQRLQFMRTFHPAIKEAVEYNPDSPWAFYLKDLTEDEVLVNFTRNHERNFFATNLRGTLTRGHWMDSKIS
jgi:hypothetical protein